MLMATKDNLDWNVITRDLSYQVDGQTYYVPNKKVHVRDDDNRAVGVTGLKYELFQNDDLKDFVMPLVEEGLLVIENMGYIGVGQKVYVQARMANEYTIAGEQHRGMITLLNSHDGSASLAAGVTDQRVICNNTFAMAMTDMSSRLRHTVGLYEKAAQISEIIDFVNERMATFSEAAEVLASTKANILMVDAMIEDAFEKPAESVRATNSIREFYRSGMGNEGKTLWDSFNAITQFTTHEAGKDAGQRFASVNFGRMAKINRRAMESALELAGV